MAVTEGVSLTFGEDTKINGAVFLLPHGGAKVIKSRAI